MIKIKRDEIIHTNSIPISLKVKIKEKLKNNLSYTFISQIKVNDLKKIKKYLINSEFNIDYDTKYGKIEIGNIPSVIRILSNNDRDEKKNYLYKKKYFSIDLNQKKKTTSNILVFTPYIIQIQENDNNENKVNYISNIYKKIQFGISYIPSNHYNYNNIFQSIIRYKEQYKKISFLYSLSTEIGKNNFFKKDNIFSYKINAQIDLPSGIVITCNYINYSKISKTNSKGFFMSLGMGYNKDKISINYIYSKRKQLTHMSMLSSINHNFYTSKHSVLTYYKFIEGLTSYISYDYERDNYISKKNKINFNSSILVGAKVEL